MVLDDVTGVATEAADRVRRDGQQAIGHVGDIARGSIPEELVAAAIGDFAASTSV